MMNMQKALWLALPATVALTLSAEGTQPSLPFLAASAAPSARLSDNRAAVTYQVAREGNTARYRVREQLVGFDLPNDAVGTTAQVSGGIAFDDAGNVVPSSSKLSINVASLTSDQARRDGYLRSRVLETAQHPNVDIVITRIRGLSGPLPSSGTRTITLDADLAIRAQTRPTTWTATVTFADKIVTGSATTAFTFENFALTRPRVPAVLSVADTIKLEYDFRLERAP